jgi:Fe2+ or Zn2+ uptake regulation protein
MTLILKIMHAVNKETIYQKLSGSGQRVTSQRLLLLDLIRKQKGHLDADDLYRRARELNPRLGLSTVYRTLRLFKELGLVEELHFQPEHHHYEQRASREHHHLVCLHCGRITEFESRHTKGLRDEIGRRHGFKVTSGEINFSGYCADCRDKAD